MEVRASAGYLGRRPEVDLKIGATDAYVGELVNPEFAYLSLLEMSGVLENTCCMLPGASPFCVGGSLPELVLTDRKEGLPSSTGGEGGLGKLAPINAASVE